MNTNTNTTTSTTSAVAPAPRTMRDSTLSHILKNQDVAGMVVKAIQDQGQVSLAYCWDRELLVYSTPSRPVDLSSHQSLDFWEVITLTPTEQYDIVLERYEETGNTPDVMKLAFALTCGWHEYSISLERVLTNLRGRVLRAARDYRKSSPEAVDVSARFEIVDTVYDCPEIADVVQYITYSASVVYDGDADRFLTEPSVTVEMKDGAKYSVWNVFDAGTCSTGTEGVPESHALIMSRVRKHFGNYVRM